MIKRSLLATLGFLVAHAACACRLDARFDPSSGRVAGIVVSVPHAATEIAALPAGWKLSIDNDPSWATTVSAHAVVGAAFLGSADALAMLRFKPEPGYSCEALGKVASTTLTLIFYRNDRLVRSRIGREHLGFVP